MSVTCRARASEMRQPVNKQMAKRQQSRGEINPSLNNRFNSLAVSTFPCPFPDTFMSVIVPEERAITRNIDFGELWLELLVIGGRDLGKYVRLSFAYVSLEAGKLMDSLINKLRLY